MKAIIGTKNKRKISITEKVFVQYFPEFTVDLQGIERPDERDTWGTYSGKLILRDISLAEALRNALVQTVPAKDSLYHL